MQINTRTSVLFTAIWLAMTWLLLSGNWIGVKYLFIPSDCKPQPDPWDVRKSWGAYSPFFPVEEYAPPPDGCEVTQVCKPC